MTTLVTGAGGFLGGAIARRLLERGDTVRSFSRGRYPELERSGIECVRDDLADPQAVSRALAGCERVFHVAALAGVWGPAEDYERANVVGTRNVVEACLTAGVSRLIYTSTPSVVFTGEAMEGVDESVPYAEHFETAYPATKARAEQLVLKANQTSLATVALRPHLIWGPGDTNLVPRILERGRRGQLRRIGRAPVLVDAVYIDNAADAHLQAADALAPDSPVAGRAYFVTQGQPMELWELVNGILAAGGVRPVTRSVPKGAAVALGAVLETVYKALKIKIEPRMTRFVARQLSTSHWFDISAARRDFGYEPQVTVKEGLRRLAESLEGSDQ